MLLLVVAAAVLPSIFNIPSLCLYCYLVFIREVLLGSRSALLFWRQSAETGSTRNDRIPLSNEWQEMLSLKELTLMQIQEAQSYNTRR